MFAALRSFIYMVGFLTLWIWLALGVRRYDAAMPFVLPGWAPGLGVAVIALGLALDVACVGTFAFAGKGTPAPFDPPRRFVAVGPYRFVRNPMYIGAWLLLTGLALWYRSPAMLLFPLFPLLLAHLFVLVGEEPGLERRFGESYARYRAGVRRWLPRLHPYRAE